MRNSKRTIRDEAVKYFVESGLVIRNPDNSAWPTNSGKTVYQIEASALRLCQSFGSRDWPKALAAYSRAARTPGMNSTENVPWRASQ
ncbi:MAG: hypothetical protein O3C40_00710 [Planctomycetota bacterium]|nr:hypothetical protein [Planctomycetota bacterium]